MQHDTNLSQTRELMKHTRSTFYKGQGDFKLVCPLQKLPDECFLPAAKLSGLREHFSLRCMSVRPSVRPYFSSVFSSVSAYYHITWIFGYHGYTIGDRWLPGKIDFPGISGFPENVIYWLHGYHILGTLRYYGLDQTWSYSINLDQTWWNWIKLAQAWLNSI